MQQFVVRGMPVELKPPVNWGMDPVENLAWRFWLHTMQFLDAPLRLYEKCADTRALAISRDLILDWIDGNQPDSKRRGDYAWFDMSVGIRASFFGYTWRECRKHQLLSDEEETKLAFSLNEHGCWLDDNANYTSQTNHGLFQDAGLFLLSTYAWGLENAPSWRSHASTRFLSTLRQHIEFEEGVHKEHSPGYQMAIRELVDRMHRQTGIGGNTLTTLIPKLDEAASWMVMPDFLLLPFGDTVVGPAPDFTQMEAAPKQGLAAFLKSGYSMVRDGSSYLAMTCCYHTYAHKHADELSWCMHEDGRLIIGEAGRYGHRDEKDPARIYARSSHGHNTLMLDDRSFDWIDEQPYGSGLLAAGEGDGWYAILGHNPLLKEIKHRRLLLYRPGHLVVVIDELETNEEREVVRRLHFGPELIACMAGDQVVAKADDVEVAVLSDWSQAEVNVSVARGVEKPRLDGWMFPSETTKLEVSAATLRTRMATGLLVHSVQMNPFRIEEAKASVVGDNFTLTLLTNGATMKLRAHRAGRMLLVSTEPNVRSPGV